MTDYDKPIKPLRGKLVTVIENKELYEHCISRERQYEEWFRSVVEDHLKEEYEEWFRSVVEDHLK